MCMWSFDHPQLFSGSGSMLKKIIELLHAPQLLLPWPKHGWASWTSQVLSLSSLSGRTHSTHPGRRRTNGRLTQVLEHFKRNLLKTSVSRMLKSFDKRRGSAQHCCAQFSLWSFLLFLKQTSRAILMTPPQERQTDHIRLTANKEQLLHKEGKKIKERTTEQTGINTEANILTWMQVVPPVHEKTTTAGWAFHFLLHVPLIRKVLVLYLLQCDWFTKKGLKKKRKKLKSSIWET